ncbi:MAG TPA: DoxX family membrane protein [Dehalococcoidia bacterium]|nr:DoxX family membrane protein [Dehalococcoidia bacterium]
MAPLFLLLRLYIGWQWLSAGIEKVNSPAWTRTGTALQGFWTNATKVDAGAKGAAVHYGWYHDFLQYMLDREWYTWFARLIAFGETVIGIALIVGAFVGVAAFFGAFMNFNFMLAGSASINPVLFALAILLVLGWKVAGYLGADYYLLPAIGTPWKPGHALESAHEEPVRPGMTTLGVLGWVVAFAAAGVVAVVANNQWNAAHPLVGYIVALAGVIVAWLAGEAILTATHRPQAEGTAGTGLPGLRPRA